MKKEVKKKMKKLRENNLKICVIDAKVWLV